MQPILQILQKVETVSQHLQKVTHKADTRPFALCDHFTGGHSFTREQAMNGSVQWVMGQTSHL